MIQTIILIMITGNNNSFCKILSTINFVYKWKEVEQLDLFCFHK